MSDAAPIRQQTTLEPRLDAPFEDGLPLRATEHFRTVGRAKLDVVCIDYGVPLLGLGLNGLWASKYGMFGKRILGEVSAPEGEIGKDGVHG